MDFLSIPYRTEKNRTYGLTSIIDLGIPRGELIHLLDDYSSYIDFAKIGIGTAYITNHLQEKINIYKKYNVKPYFGGTFFEKCYHQNKIPEYVEELKKLGVEWIEVSTGTLDIPLADRLHLVSELKAEGFQCFAEVGSKDTNKEMPIIEWKNEIQLFLNVGCEYVITEGRDSGTSGIYHGNGQIRTSLIQELLKDLDSKKIIFEAPTPKHQMYFIKEIGANVNLGNIKPSDVLVLEAERCALRSETFFMEDMECKLL